MPRGSAQRSAERRLYYVHNTVVSTVYRVFGARMSVYTCHFVGTSLYYVVQLYSTNYQLTTISRVLQ